MLAVRRHLHHIGPLTLWSADGDATAFVLSAPPPAGWSLADDGDLDLLRGLPLALRRRLALCTHVAWARRGVGPHGIGATPAVDAARQAILGRAIRDAVLDALRVVDPGAGGAVDTRVRWTVVGLADRPSAQGRARRSAGVSAQVQVPPTWLTAVWAPGRGVTADGGIVLAVAPGPAVELVRVARWTADDRDGWTLRTSVEAAPPSPVR